MGHVLIIDDDRMVAQLLQEHLSNEGYDVTTVSEAEEGLATAAKTPPDLILLDVNLPDATGFQVCGKLRENSVTKSIPIIMMTGAARWPNQQAIGLQLGANAYILKPFSVVDVGNRVHSFIGAKRNTAKPAAKPSEPKPSPTPNAAPVKMPSQPRPQLTSFRDEFGGAGAPIPVPPAPQPMKPLQTPRPAEPHPALASQQEQLRPLDAKPGAVEPSSPEQRQSTAETKSRSALASLQDQLKRLDVARPPFPKAQEPRPPMETSLLSSEEKKADPAADAVSVPPAARNGNEGPDLLGDSPVRGFLIQAQIHEKHFFDFSAEVLALASRLPKTQAGMHVANRLLRSGTAVGSKVQELEWVETAADFLLTMQQALKEIRQAGYWIRLLSRAKLLEDPALAELEKRTQELTAVLAKAILPAKQKPPLP